MTLGDIRQTEANRLDILNSLPRGHQDYFFAEIQSLCAKFIGRTSRTGAKIDRESEAAELFSEVMAKLLMGGTAVEATQRWETNDDPKRDGRVGWLIETVGGSQALSHRHEDIRRRQYGGKWKEDGYRQVQLEQHHVDALSVDADDPLHDEDVRRIWRGLLAAAKSDFKSNDDVSILLDLLAHDSDVQAEFGSEWPVSKIVGELNQRHRGSIWNDDRVDNAKKRLKNWIGRMKRDLGLDSADLMDLLALHPSAGKSPSKKDGKW
jgi:hypothetical protein